MQLLQSIPWDDPNTIQELLKFLTALVGVLALLIPDIRSLLAGVLGLVARPFLQMAAKTKKALVWKGESQETDDGVFYKAEGESRPDTLVIMIHGILGSALDSWGGVPDLLQTHVNAWHSKALNDSERAPDDPAPVRFDVLLFQYPAGLFSKSSIELGAAHLLEAMKNYRQYRHLIFITHSTGGLIIKRAFIDDIEQFYEDLANKEKPIASVFGGTITGRARQIVNFAVPHGGGSFFYSLLLFPLYSVLFLLLALLWVPQKLASFFVKPIRGFDYGLNRIGWELRHRRLRKGPNALDDLEREYRTSITRLDSDVLPRPASVEISGRSDSVVDRPKNDVSGGDPSHQRGTDKADLSLLFRGSHPTVKQASTSDDQVILFIASFLRRYQQPFEVSLAETTLHRAMQLDRNFALIGDHELDRPAYSAWERGRGMRGTITSLQASVFRTLHEETRQAHMETPLYLVTGDVGAGKTVALRTYARSLSMSFLNAPNDVETLPVFIPLQMMKKVAAPETGEALATSLLSEFHRLANKRYLTTLPDHWLEHRWHRRRTVVIFDSVDEFFLNNPAVSRECFREAVNCIQDQVRGEGHVSLVAGIRWGEPVLDSLRDDAIVALHVRWLSLLEACRYFPKARWAIEALLVDNLCRQQIAKDMARSTVRARVNAVVDNMLDTPSSNMSHERTPLEIEIAKLVTRDTLSKPHEQVLSVVRTPLVLSELQADQREDEDDCLELRDIRFPHEVLDYALTVNIKKSRLHRKKLDGGELSVDNWKSALSLIAMVFSAAYAPELTRDDVQKAVVARQKIWENHVWPSGADKDKNDISQALAIINDEGLLTVLLNKTVFFPLGELLRFKHREWQDFLLGRYFAFSFKNANLIEVVSSSFTTRAHLFGGNMLVEAKFAFTREYAASIAVQMKRKWGQFVLGNLGALIGKSPVPIKGNALELLLDEEVEQAMPHGGKFVLLAGLGYRLLRGNEDTDPSYHDIGKHLVPLFQRIVEQAWDDPSKLDGNERLHASVAYCYLKQLDRLPGQSDQGWPELDLSDAHEQQIIDRLHSEWREDRFLSESELPPVYKSCQTAFLTVQEEEYNHAHRHISLVHYLYTLCLSRKHGVAISFVRNRLTSVLRDDGELAKACLASQSDVPVWTIFNKCRNLGIDDTSE